MSELTLKRVDAAIYKATGVSAVGYERRIFLAGRESARKEIDGTLADDGWTSTEHQQVILRATNRRLKKEMRNA